MIRLFARWQDSRPSSESRTGSADRPGRRVRRRAQPEAVVLDSRLLMDASHSGTTAADGSAELASRVAQVVKSYIAADDFPGISVSIVKDGQVALAQGYGVSDVASHSPVEAGTRFDIGSLTKTFTAVGVLLLYQESQGTSHPLDLNAPISDYLHNTPTFKLPRKWDNITTMELLDMTSGIRDVGGPRPWYDELDAVANQRLLYTPGTESSYSSANYDLLGEMIQQWTGENYGTFVQDRILNPLGMSGSEELGGAAKVPDQAVGYNASRHGRWSRIALQDGTAMFAGAGMISTAQDMATYMTALLSGRLLDPATYALMWTATPTPHYGSNPTTDDVRGLGWDTVIDTSTGTTEAAKSGLVPGFSSELILYPSTDSGVFVSFNTNHSSVNALQVAEAVHAATQAGSQ